MHQGGDEEAPGDRPELPPGDRPMVLQGGWGNETPKGRPRNKEGGGEIGFDPRLEMDAPDVDDGDYGEGSDDDTPAIPTLEQAQEESLTSAVSQAPTQNINVPTYADLEKSLAHSMPFTATDSGIDLKLLTDVLSPPDKIQEPDEVWEFETQWYAITGAMADEKEASEAKVAEGGDAAANADAAYL